MNSTLTPVTDPEAAALLARIEDFGFDVAADPLGFASRLADDQRWTLGYALAVTQEYQRFLVLTQFAGRAVSPSPDVDEAWHLHLTRTAHYDAFCRAASGRRSRSIAVSWRGPSIRPRPSAWPRRRTPACVSRTRASQCSRWPIRSKAG